MEQTIVSKAELARRLNVSRARITQLCNDGMPVLADGKLELQAALDWISSHVDRSRDVGRVRKPAPAQTVSSTGPSMQDAGRALLIARAKKALAEAKLTERRERNQARELIERTTVNEYIAMFSTLVRDHVLAQADRLAAMVAALNNEKQIYDLIRRDGRTLLEKLSKAIHDSDLERA
jgi:hypothetical protein